MQKKLTYQNLSSFYSILKTKVDFIDNFKEEFSKTLASDFNSLDFWYVGENKVSEIITFLLDPNETHGQKDTFLKLFLKEFNISFPYSDGKDIIAVTEKPTHNNRRVDIYLKNIATQEVIAIENKIYTSTADQIDQVNDYLRYLTLYHNNSKFSFFYLAPRGKSISTHSYNNAKLLNEGIKSEIEIKNYEDHLIPLLHTFAINSENDRVRNFILDFEKKLKSIYMNIDPINSSQTIQDFITEDTDKLKLSFDIASNLTSVKNSLRTDLDNQLEDLANELSLQFDRSSRRYSLDKIGDHLVGVSFESGGVFIGLVRKTDDKIYRQFISIDSLFTGRYENSYWWPIYIWQYRNIETNAEFWLSIKNGTFKETVRQFLETLQNNDYEMTNSYGAPSI